MKYTMYQEEHSTVTYDKYLQLKQSLLNDQSKKSLEEFTLRKLQFIGAVDSDAVPNYFLCVKNQDEEQIYLEKKYIQNRIYYKKCTKLTKEEYERIYHGDLEWMKNHKNPLFVEFYLQITLNHLRPGYLTEYSREMMHCRKEGYVTFFHRIERAAGSRTGLFDRPYMLISCLDEGKVLVTYKKVVSIPGVIGSMLQGQEETNEDLGFVF